MMTAAQRTETQIENEQAISRSQEDWLGPADLDEAVIRTDDPGNDAGPAQSRPLAILLTLLALGWIAFAAWRIAAAGAFDPVAIATALPLASIPLILIGVVWMIFGRANSRETQRFRTAVAHMHRESAALESILAIVSSRLEENHTRLTGEAAKLMTLGDEASDRLGRVAHYLSKESAGLDRQAERLESAANNARVDIGVLLSDLPRAEAQAQAVADAMKNAGLAALGEAGQLESQLSALVARGREADEVVGGTAQRLAAHLARIETNTAAAKAQLDTVTSGMTQAVDDSLARTADAVDAARTSLDMQGRAMLAMIEQSRSALEEAGEVSGRNLAARLDQVGGQLAALAEQLAAQDAASAALVSGLSHNLAELDERFVAIGQTGNANNEALGGSIEMLRTRLGELHAEVGGGQERSAELIARAGEMAEALAGITSQLRNDLPQALSSVEQQAVQTRGAAESLAPIIEAVQIAACDAASQAAAAEASIGRQRAALDALLAHIGDSVRGTEEQLRALGGAVESADAAAGKMVSDTGPELIEALLRVREAATQAADRARETIGAIIPQSAAQLGDASRAAVNAAIAETLEDQISELSRLSERATETARAASERLTRQMMGIGEAAAAVEARIDAARAGQAAQDSESFSRRVALLIESLNSTAIDVAKILSNEVTDDQWAAYLKGDRGVFTRRAVRLLDASETREIGHYYQSDPEFREQVGRYIHDFEAMLRRVLAEREGNALGVTILSSDMGKLYVALAQAIERLRN